MTLACSTCIFWLPDTERPASNFGQCRRYPPPQVMMPAGLRSYHPLTHHADWCGEHTEVKIIDAATKGEKDGEV